MTGPTGPATRRRDIMPVTTVAVDLATATTVDVLLRGVRVWLHVRSDQAGRHTASCTHVHIRPKCESACGGKPDSNECARRKEPHRCDAQSGALSASPRRKARLRSQVRPEWHVPGHTVERAGTAGEPHSVACSSGDATEAV